MKRLLLLITLTPVLSLNFLGCATLPSGVNVSLPELPPTIPIQSSQNFKGYYVCGQGATNLNLNINSVIMIDNSHYADVAATFDFNFNNGSCVGQFTLHGQYDAARHRLRLEPGEWIANPCNYSAVGMNGVITVDGRGFNGRITGANGCKEFRLTLAE